MVSLDLMIVHSITPMNGDHDVDLDAAARHFKRLEALGVESVALLGAAGEFGSLSIEQKEAFVWSAVNHFNRDVVVCAAGKDYEEVLDLVVYSKNIGADAAMVPPLLGSAEPPAEFFSRLAHDSGFPLIIYNNPALAPQIPAGDVMEVGKIIHGINDCSGDMFYFMQIIAAARQSGFRVYQGDERAVYISRALGASGFAPSMANLSPEFCRGAWTDTDSQAALSGLRSVVYPEGKVVQGIKYALSCIDLCHPFHSEAEDLSQAEKNKIDEGIAGIVEIPLP